MSATRWRSRPAGIVGVVQIAGLIARRIVPFVKEGDMIGTGERFGLIRFGSRVDVYLPLGVVPLVGEGQTAIAGETVLADFTANEARHGFIAGFDVIRARARSACADTTVRREIRLPERGVISHAGDGPASAQRHFAPQRVRDDPPPA
jgi:hypothetical protein